ncbi:MAG: aminoacyl-tRNA hydrolase [Leptospiraceae bacterium]|nr:aminoacyl-tRNA hydrolase [Leptospiraceae bacterium]
MSESDKYIIAGLGNPGQRYAFTRHNIGFIVLDELSQKLGASFSDDKKFLIAKTSFETKTIFLLKPQEFMNLSGKAIATNATKYKISSQKILVIHDEVDFPFARIKVKFSGGHAGHNGLRDIIEKLGTNDFHRIRFGVGRPEKESPIDVSDFVLSNFSSEEKKELPKLIQNTTQMALEWLKTN